MQMSRRVSLKGLAIATALALNGSIASAQFSEKIGSQDFRVDKVFTTTNSTLGNEVLVFGRSADGQSTALLKRYATRGNGSGGALRNQGAVTLSKDGNWLFVVNHRSGTVSTFAVAASGLSLKSVVVSGEGRPLSVTESGGVVYVLGDEFYSLAGFRNLNGQLTPIPGSFRSLGGENGGADPTQVSFSPDGSLLIANLRRFDGISSYRVAPGGLTDAAASALATAPGGFGFDPLGRLLVSETLGRLQPLGPPTVANRGAVSLYNFIPGNSAITPVPVDRSVGNGQTGTARLSVTPNGRFVYTTNTESNTVSSYAITSAGRLVLSQAVAARTGAAPTDLAVAPTGRVLWVLNSGVQTLSAFAIGPDGQLTLTGDATGLPFGANGLALN